LYYVNEEQIERRLAVIPELMQAMDALNREWNGGLLQALAQERTLHLAIEVVTDVGSYLIDGFLMREASSYEDIIEIIAEENAIPAELAGPLTQLVKLRRPLVQDYFALDRSALHPLVRELPVVLERFFHSVRDYLAKELNRF
jgi:uncharacterized protein YutE (UPF0331/DUF86 family)